VVFYNARSRADDDDDGVNASLTAQVMNDYFQNICFSAISAW